VISAGTIFLFLAGQRRAIERVAASPRSLWLGLAFVVLAGIFREYDQEALLFEPWHLMLPLAASTGLAGLLFGVVYLIVFDNRRGPGSFEFRQLLSCLWMCAPMAALYAIPVERWGSAVEATRWNLTFLGIVSVWRVTLISRVISVLFQFSFLTALFPVMLLSVTIAVILSIHIPLPLIQVMGGIQLSESERLINEVRASIMLAGFVSWPIWLIGSILLVFRARKRARESSPARPQDERAVELIPAAAGMGRSDDRRNEEGNLVAVGRSAWLLAGAGFVLMGIASCFTQPEQHRRYIAERLLYRGESEAAMAWITRFELRDFPPHWEPPPRISYGEREGDAFRHLGAALRHSATRPWVIDLFGQKLVQVRGYGDEWEHRFLRERTSEELEVIAELIEHDLRWEPRLAPPGRTSLRCFIGEVLAEGSQTVIDSHSSERKEVPPRRLLERLLAASSDSEDCPSEDELRQRLATVDLPHDGGE
jgi:hypothetical protein